MEFIIGKRPLDSLIKLALNSQYDRTSAVDLVTDGTLIILQQIENTADTQQTKKSKVYI